MAYLNRFLSYFSRLLNPRPYLARDWKRVSQEYERNLRLNKTVNPEIIEAIIKEKNRIQALFTELLPEFAGRIFIVSINEVQVEQCAVFTWENDLCIAVSAALIARPIDHLEDTGMKAWKWIARHEIAHVRFCHLPWLFYTRRFFLASQWLFFIYAAFIYLQVVDGSWFNSVVSICSRSLGVADDCGSCLRA